MSKIDPFSEGNTSTVFGAHLSKVLREIDELDTEYVLKASSIELEQHFIEKARIEPLVLGDHYIEGTRGVQIDVSRDFARVVFPGRQARVTGTQVDVAIPFEGDPLLWKLRPSKFGLSGWRQIVLQDAKVLATFTF